MWQGRASDDEVRKVLLQQLSRLSEHVSVALSAQDDDRVRDLLDRISAELQSHLETLTTP